MKFGLSGLLAALIVGAASFASCTVDSSSTSVDGSSSSSSSSSGEMASSGVMLCTPGEAGCNRCETDSHCTSKNCVAGECAAASCTDAKRDGDEEGVDCGGASCKKCDGSACATNADCKSAACADDVCAPAGSKFCGIGLRRSCADAEPCQADADCSSDYCADAGTCAAIPANVHADGRRNGGETGVDCGGSVRATQLCGGNQVCLVEADCEGHCDPAVGTMPKKCSVPKHNDGKISPSLGETDIDCGGNTPDVDARPATRCRSGKNCADGPRDCESRFCSAPAAGMALTCEVRKAGRKDGDESDVDCGGTADPDTMTVPARCAEEKGCAVDGDCGTSSCNRVENKCVAARSCRAEIGMATAGISTCGRIGFSETCCRSLTIPSTTKRMDKYEVTAGRMRQFIEFLRDAKDPAGAPYNYNMRKWVADEIAIPTSTVGANLNAQIPAAVRDMLPSTTNVKTPLNMIVQLGATSMDGRFPVPVQGCFTGVTRSTCKTRAIPHDPGSTCTETNLENGMPSTCKTRAIAGNTASACTEYNYDYGSYGHATYWQPQAVYEDFFFVSHPGRRFSQAAMDEKSMNCAPYWVYAAFCAWDGGRLPTAAEKSQIYPGAYPWTPAAWAAAPGTGKPIIPAIGVNWMDTVNLQNSQRFFYHMPNDGGPYGGPQDSSGFIAAPGHFFLDASAIVDPVRNESWMDLAGNMIEIHADVTASGNTFCDTSITSGETTNCVGVGSQPGVLRKSNVPVGYWRGGSWEDHALNSTWGAGFPLHTQYGKLGVRCIR